MKERLLRRPLAFYALRECTARPVAVVTVFLVMTVSFCILFNLYFLSYGSCLARLEQAGSAAPGSASSFRRIICCPF